MTHPEHLEFLSPDHLAPPPGYSQLVRVRAGQTIYIAGQIALDAEGKLVGANDFQAQTQQVFENLKIALAEVGADFSHVVKLNYYVLDKTQALALREIRDQYVNTLHPPASTLVEVCSLSRDDFLIEIEAVASVPA